MCSLYLHITHWCILFKLLMLCMMLRIILHCSVQEELEENGAWNSKEISKNEVLRNKSVQEASINTIFLFINFAVKFLSPFRKNIILCFSLYIWFLLFLPQWWLSTNASLINTPMLPRQLYWLNIKLFLTRGWLDVVSENIQIQHSTGATKLLDIYKIRMNKHTIWWISVVCE